MRRRWRKELDESTHVVGGERDDLSDLEDGSVEAETLVDDGGGVRVSVVGVGPDAEVDLVPLVEGPRWQLGEHGVQQWQ